jgi:hypothetical protein
MGAADRHRPVVIGDKPRALSAACRRTLQRLNTGKNTMKTITYATAFMIFAATAACEQQSNSNQGAASPNTAAPQNTSTAPVPGSAVAPSQIRQLRENVLTNQ